MNLAPVPVAHAHGDGASVLASNHGSTSSSSDLRESVKGHLTDFLKVYGIMLNDLKVLILPKDDRRRELLSLQALGLTPIASVREWQFKRKFRTNAYGWRASSLAIGRLKEAAAEIRSVAKSDPDAAGDGVVSLIERIWPAFQGIDTSSGALGAAVSRTVNELIPILTVASADHATRGKWLERLFEAVQNDGVEYLAPLEDRWGEIAQYPDLIDDYADRMIGMVRRAWADHQTLQHVIGTSICLSCLLEGGRYGELQELLATRRMKFFNPGGPSAGSFIGGKTSSRSPSTGAS